MSPSAPLSRGRPVEGQIIAVGVGELAVTDDANTILATYALGSCVAVCVWDPISRVAGLLHALLPSADDHSGRARTQPAAFVDSGVRQLFEEAARRGLQKSRTVVHLLGGAELERSSVPRLQIGRRNVLAARKALWAAGVLVAGEAVGGQSPRSVSLRAGSGVVEIRTGLDRMVIEWEGSDGHQ